MIAHTLVEEQSSQRGRGSSGDIKWATMSGYCCLKDNSSEAALLFAGMLVWAGYGPAADTTPIENFFFPWRCHDCGYHYQKRTIVSDGSETSERYVLTSKTYDCIDWALQWAAWSELCERVREEQNKSSIFS
jgi:hypothetical protein